MTLAARVSDLARTDPDGLAYITPDRRFTWRDYDELSTVWGRHLTTRADPGDRVAVILPDGPEVHATYLAAEKAGLVTVGIGARAGRREVDHLIELTGARFAITEPLPLDAPDDITLPGTGADELFLLNSTSGTTGLPKCVMHDQARWFAFHEIAVEASDLTSDDVFLGALPAPFGFGLWTAHFTPTILGVPTVVADRFDAGQTLDLIERERVTVLCCVSTQFILLLNEQAQRARDLSSLRVMFTGGEAVPYERAAAFEDETGAAVLQFYGSNETGALSRTTLRDTRDDRLRTAGQVLDEMHVRLFDPDTGDDITGSGRPGQPACKGPVTCLGYYGDDAANKQLYTPDGWMLMGDIVEIDDRGYLRVVGRTSDFIIRGGKNISAPAVEAEVATHPGVAIVACVPAPDPVFGERVAAYVVTREGHEVTLESIAGHLAGRGVSKEWFPERLVVLDELPRSSGGKVAKGDLRADAAERFSSSSR